MADRNKLKNKKLFLFDIDGTLAVGDTLYDGSRELLEYIDRIGGKAYFITNNSTKSGADYVAKFRRAFRLETTEDQFITSGYMTLKFLLEHYRDRKIFVLGTASFIEELRKNSLNITETCEDGIDCVVVAYDSELTYDKLTETCKVLFTQEVPFYGTNPDLRCPIDFGFIPDCGSICNMITATTGKKPVYLGKPSRGVVDLCRELSGFTAAETLVVGDRLYTDIACGINGEVDTCVLFTGEARPEDMADTEFPADYAFDNVRKLLDAILYPPAKQAMKAVVFDMDGVLFDTERLCMNVWVQLAGEKKLEGMQEFFPLCIGRNETDTRQLFAERYGADTDYEMFRKEASRRFHESIETDGVPLKEGVKEILEFLKNAGFRIGLASSSSRPSVLSLIGQAGIRDYFEAVITGDMITHSKPLPDIYLIACDKLGTTPEESYAIEDSYNGIRSAHAAGMVPVMVPDVLPPDREMEEKSFLICKDLSSVAAYLESTIRVYGD